MKIGNIFKNLGLEDKEKDLYLACLELGVSSASEIAKKAGIQRTHFYDLYKKLATLGLLQQIKKGAKNLFVAADPEKILEIQKKYLQDIETALPELKALYNTSGQKPKVFYFEGIAGIHQINDDLLIQDGDIVGFTTPRFVKMNNEKMSREFIEKRIRLGKKVKVIGELSPEIAILKKKDTDELRETRILPKEIFSSDVEIGIYNNRVFVANYKNTFGFIIEDTDFADTMKKIFGIVWNSGKVLEDKNLK